MIQQILENIQLVLVFAATFLAALWYLRRPKNLPPGPYGLPILGVLPFSGMNLAPYAKKQADKYKSPVISFMLGPKLVVVLNTKEAINEGFSRSDKFVDRGDNMGKRFLRQGRGIVAADGQTWRDQRRFALSILRDFGMGKIAVEEKILDEIVHTKEYLDSLEGKEFDPQHILTNVVSNIICSIVFGNRFEYSNKDFQNLINQFQIIPQIVTMTNPVNLIPSLRHMPGDPFKFKLLCRTMDTINAFLRDRVEEHRAAFDRNNIKDFIDAYIDEMENEKERGNTDTTFNDEQMFYVISDLFFAGTETTSTTLRWGLAYMVHHPEIQEKCQQEIDDNIGRDNLPTMKDRLRLPFTDATVNEIHRFASLVPLSLPHTCLSEEAKLYDYTIPKETLLFANTYALHHDENLWTNPHNFDPNNFIGPNGKLRNHEYLLPFSLGKRQCIGEAMAKMEIFLYFTSILQSYKVIPSGELPDLDCPYTLVREIHSYKIRLEKR